MSPTRRRSQRSRRALSSNGVRNQILASLPPAEFARLHESLTRVPLSFKERISEQDKPVKYIVFPEDGVLSYVTDLADGGLLETGTAGREGFTDVAAFLGIARAPGTAICQVPGHGYRMPLAVVQRERDQNSQLAVKMSLYTGAFIAMLAQTAACNRAHPVDERMARWLLMTHDRVDGDDFPLTQEFLAMMLGVRRPSVNVAGLALQEAGLIRYTRGKITIVERSGLESASCECYGQIARLFDDALEL